MCILYLSVVCSYILPEEETASCNVSCESNDHYQSMYFIWQEFFLLVP